MIGQIYVSARDTTGQIALNLKYKQFIMDIGVIAEYNIKIKQYISEGGIYTICKRGDRIPNSKQTNEYEITFRMTKQKNDQIYN